MTSVEYTRKVTKPPDLKISKPKFHFRSPSTVSNLNFTFATTQQSGTIHSICMWMLYNIKYRLYSMSLSHLSFSRNKTPPNARAKPYFRVILRLNISYQKFVATPRDISQILVQNLTKTARGLFENKARPTGCSKESLSQRPDHSASPERFMKQMWATKLLEIGNRTSAVNLKHYISGFWAMWKIYVRTHPLNRCNGKAREWGWFPGRFGEISQGRRATSHIIYL